MVLFKHMCSWLVVETLDFSILLASQGRPHLCCNCCLFSARPKAWDQVGTSGRNKVAFTELVSSYSWAWASLHFLISLADKNGNLMKFQPMEWEKHVPLPRLAWEDPRVRQSILFPLTTVLWETREVIWEAAYGGWWGPQRGGNTWDLGALRLQ